MVHGPHTIKVVEGIVNLLALLADEGLYEATVVVDTDHGRDIALQLRHLARSPRREIAERHLIAFADDVVELVEHLEVDIVDLLHLALQHLGLHHRIEQHLVCTLDGCQHVEAFHQVGHTHVVMTMCLLFAGLQQVFVQQPVGVVGVETDFVDVNGGTVDHSGAGMNPDGILATFEHTTEDCSQRAWP